MVMVNPEGILKVSPDILKRIHDRHEGDATKLRGIREVLRKMYLKESAYWIEVIDNKLPKVEKSHDQAKKLLRDINFYALNLKAYCQM